MQLQEELTEVGDAGAAGLGAMQEKDAQKSEQIAKLNSALEDALSEVG